MYLSANIHPISKKVGFEKAIDLLQSVGFEAYDMSFDEPEENLICEGWQDNVKAMRKYADSKGIVCNQAHAPFPTAVADRQRSEDIFKRIVMAMEGAAILGARIIVVHAISFLYPITFSEDLYRINMEFFEKLIPYCEQFGIKVAIENCWTYKNDIQSNAYILHALPDTVGRVEDFNRYIDTLNSPWIVGCVDVGHLALMGADPYDWILKAAHRVEALHIHDNNLLQDSHMIPFFGDIPFDRVIHALKEIGYNGDCTLEIDIKSSLPAAMLKSTVQCAYESLIYIRKQIEK